MDDMDDEDVVKKFIFRYLDIPSRIVHAILLNATIKIF